MTSDSGAEVQIWPFRACAMHPAIIIGTLRSLWTWLRGRRSTKRISLSCYECLSCSSFSYMPSY